ncbi:MAG: magnesium/cobalt transporter CorA [bacterium]
MVFSEEVKHSDNQTLPGEPVHLPGYKYYPTNIDIIDYDSGTMEEKPAATAADFSELIDSNTVTWIDVKGLKNVELLKEIQSQFKIHPLVIEDLLRPYQRPKLEIYDDHLFIIMRLIHRGKELKSEQIGLVIGKNYLITFQEFSEDVFDPVRRRLRQGRKRIRAGGPDYLAYSLLDTVVDSYFPILEETGDRLEELEDKILAATEPDNLQQLHKHKRSLLVLRRAAWAQRETIGQLQREEMEFFSPETRLFLRDSYDHAIRVLEIIEGYRELAASLTDLHMTSISNRMNEIMKVLTIIGTIFLPLTFIAGVYGMNFDAEASPYNMPELYWYWGYPAIMGLMLAIAIGLLFFFRSKKWL